MGGCHHLLRGRLGDTVLFIAVAVTTVGGSLLVAGQPGARPLWPGGLLVVAASVVVLAWRHTYPWPVLATTAGTAVAYYLLDYPAGFEPLPFLFALYVAAAEGHRVIAIVSAVAASGAAQAAQIMSDGEPDSSELIAVVATLAAVVALGEVRRARLAYVGEVRRAWEREAGRRVAEERVRIARELHDVLAHHISVINMQAGAALLRQDVEIAFDSLDTIKLSSANAMRELRTTLGVLRSGDSERVDPSLAPAPSLASLNELVTHTEQVSGAAVSFYVTGEQQELPANVRTRGVPDRAGGIDERHPARRRDRGHRTFGTRAPPSRD